MEVKGMALIANKIRNRDRVYMGGIDKYEGLFLRVIDRNERGDCLVLDRNGVGIGDFLSDDILCFVPLKKNNLGVIVPIELDMIQQGYWSAVAMKVGIDKFNVDFISDCIKRQGIDKDFVNKYNR